MKEGMGGTMATMRIRWNNSAVARGEGGFVEIDKSIFGVLVILKVQE